MSTPRLPNSVTQPPSSIVIIGICSVVLLLLQNISASLALWPIESGFFKPWQLLSYAFLHGGLNHLFFNMFAVWMFGLQLERTWGTMRFLQYYVVCAVGAGIVQLIVQASTGSMAPTIGASGAVFGLLLAYGAMWPDNRVMLIFFPVPIKAKWFVLIYGAVELVFGITSTAPGIAHFAHLGGLFFGAGLLYYWGWRPSMTWRK